MIWSDECSFERSLDPSVDWVFRKPAGKYHKDCVRREKKSGAIELMIWACFSGRRKGPLIPIVMKRVDQFVYRDILKHFLPRIWGTLTKAGIDPIFMQDNAPVHKADLIIRWFREKGYVVMEWPPYSLDLNPIEHVWRKLKIELQKRYPRLKDMAGGLDTIKSEMTEIIPELWYELAGDYFENLVRSMPYGAEAVIRAEGWYTKY